MARVSVVELRGRHRLLVLQNLLVYVAAIVWCLWLLELGASCWLLAGWHFWWLEFFFALVARTQDFLALVVGCW